MTQPSSTSGRICQGDLIRDVDYYERVTLADGSYDAKAIAFPLVVGACPIRS